MAYKLTKEIFIVGAKRTAFGAYGGSLKDMSANDLQVVATKAALDSAKVDAGLVDSVCIGNVMQSSPDAAYISRYGAVDHVVKA